ncbi:MAG: AMP-binding protein [Egibacteraceae bacterium]
MPWGAKRTPGLGHMPVTPLADRAGDTVAAVLRRHAARAPDRPFLLFEREPGCVETTTWGELDARVGATAGALHRRGVRAGDRFHVHLQNCPQFYDLLFAAALIGSVIVPSNPLSTPDELGYLIDHAGCRLSVTTPDLRAAVEKAGAEQIVGIDEEWVEPGDGFHDPSPAAPTDVLSVLYTSGTTSRPKGVLVTHAAYLHCGDVVAGHLRLRPDDRNLVVLPLFHGNAQYYSTMSAVVTGASIALAPRFSASRFAEQAVAMDATVASLFAAPIRMILAAKPTDHDAAHRLRVALFAQNVSDAQHAEFERRFAVPLAQLYGMTETVVPPTINPLYEERRPASIGRAVLGARLRIVAPDGLDVEPGEAGELLVGGEPGRTLMAGYLGNPDATAEALRPGESGLVWLHTGDTVRADADGYLRFVDRRKDMIKRAGENVASGEVERVVDEHPAVFESAAVGVPDEMRDEAIQVFVVLAEGATVTADELLAHCRERLAKFKVPDTIEFVDELPRTSVGKIQKHLLRRRSP